MLGSHSNHGERSITVTACALRDAAPREAGKVGADDDDPLAVLITGVERLAMGRNVQGQDRFSTCSRARNAVANYSLAA